MATSHGRQRPEARDLHVGVAEYTHAPQVPVTSWLGGRSVKTVLGHQLRIGAGLGGLPWDDVVAVLETELTPLPYVEVWSLQAG